MLATTNDLVAVGALKSTDPARDHRVAHADTLLGLAQGQVLTYVRATESQVLSWPDASQSTVVAVIVDLAGRRLSQPAASTVTQPVTALLDDNDREVLRSVPQVAAAYETSRVGLGALIRDGSYLTVTGTGYPAAAEGFFG